jgi:hypothetical protein
VGWRACGSGEHGSPITPVSSANSPGAAHAATSARAAAAMAPSVGATPADALHNEAGAGRVVFFSPWGGSTKDQLGHDRPLEGNPTGPMSLGHDAKGRVYVLDQVNGRVVRHGVDGKAEASSDVRLRNAQDLAVAADGSMAVLDRLGDKAIAFYGTDGVLRGQLPLEGEGIEETGLLTGVFIDGKDVYVEREHGTLINIGDTSGNPAEPRKEIPGRPTRDGTGFLTAGITDAAAGRAWLALVDRATGDHRFTRELRLKAEIRSIRLLDSDKAGTIYLATEMHQEPAEDWILLQCLDALKGVPIGSATLPANTMPEETFRDLTVLDEGGVVLAHQTEQGVTYQTYECN